MRIRYHGHQAGECTNLVTLPEVSLCKPCFDRSLEELNDLDPKRGKKDERKKGRNYRSAASGSTRRQRSEHGPAGVSSRRRPMSFRYWYIADIDADDEYVRFWG